MSYGIVFSNLFSVEFGHVFEYFLLRLALDMALLDVVHKPIVSTDAKLINVKVNIDKHFTNEHEFIVPDHILL